MRPYDYFGLGLPMGSRRTGQNAYTSDLGGIFAPLQLGIGHVKSPPEAADI